MTQASEADEAGLSSYLAQTKAVLRALGSPTPDADVVAYKGYIVRARGAGLAPGSAANMIYGMHYGFSPGMLYPSAGQEAPKDAELARQAVAGLPRLQGFYSVNRVLGPTRPMIEGAAVFEIVARQISPNPIYYVEVFEGEATVYDGRHQVVRTFTGAAECAGGCGPSCSCGPCQAKHHPEAVAVLAAGETARVLYEDRPRKPKVLRWHRTSAGYEAQGSLGRYSIVFRKPDRRHGVLPVLLSLNDAELKAFDTKHDAVRYAWRWERGKALKPSDFEPAAPTTSASPPCGPLARIAIDPAAAAACKARADAIGPLDSPQDVYRLIYAELASHDQEVFVVIPLNVQGLLIQQPIQVAQGQRSRVEVDTADILRAVILSGAAQYYVVHCHPSGKAAPSPADKRLTEIIQTASDAAFGKARGVKPSVEFIDHLVIGNKQVASARSGKVYKVS